MLEIFNDEFFMKQALIEAQKALDKNEVPVGAVVVLNNRVIARTHNLTEQLTDVTAHAEVQAITAAAQYLGAKYLKGCTMYVSLEPCSHFGKTPPCANLIVDSGIKNVVIGVIDANNKVSGNGVKYLQNNGCNVKVGVFEEAVPTSLSLASSSLSSSSS